MRWIWRGFCAGPARAREQPGSRMDAYEGRDVAVRWTSCTPGDRRRGAAAGRPRARRGPSPSEPPAYEQPLLELGLPPAPRALAGEPAQLLGPRGLPALRLPLLPRAERCGCRRVDAPPRRARRRAAGARARCCAARSCTGCSSGSTSRGPRCRPTRRWPRLIELHGVEARADEVADLRAWSSASRARSCASASPRRSARAHRAAVRLHARAAGCRRAQPADQRRGGRPRRRRARGTLVVD